MTSCHDTTFNDCCKDKATADLAMTLLSGHVETCPNRQSDRDVLIALIDDLVEGIEEWGRDADGIHEKLFEAYGRAKMLKVRAKMQKVREQNENKTT